MVTPRSDEDMYAAINMEKMINTIKKSIHHTINEFLNGEGIDMIGFAMPDGSYMLHPTIANNVKSFVKGEMLNDKIVHYLAKAIVNDLISNHIEG